VLPAGALVLTDGQDDAGIWVGVLTPDVNYFTKVYLSFHPDDSRLVAMQGACDDPQRAQAALRGIDAVFVGSKRWSAPVHPWTERCIAALPALHLVAQAGPSAQHTALYRVDHTVIP
jgi:hypothetical protein